MASLRPFAAWMIALWLAFGVAVMAQDTAGPDYAAWDKLAGQAEQILQSGQANDARLDAIRSEVVKWRTRFSEAEGSNATRIATLKDQISALGPLPAEGVVESDDMIARRKALNDQLAELQAPGLNAAEGYGRADGIIQQIDRAQRERQTNALLRVAPTPLNPANWGLALQDGVRLFGGIKAEVVQRWRDQNGWASAANWGQVVTALMLIAAALLIWGRRWVTTAPARLMARSSERIRAVAVFGVSLGQIVIPVLGVLLAVGAVLATGIAGEWLRPILIAIPKGAFLAYSGFWLVGRLFPKPGTGGLEALPMPDAQRARARFSGGALAGVAGIHQIFSDKILPLSGFMNQPITEERVPMSFSDASAAVWHFPMIVIGAYFLYRLGNVLRLTMRYEDSESGQFRRKVAATIGNLVRAVAIVSVVLVVLGYVSMANALLWPCVISMALIGLLILLQDFIADLYAMAKGGGQAARDALMPMVIGFVLVLLSVPLFLLIWGARRTELLEYWGQLRQGITVAGINISPTGILTFIVIFVLGFSFTRFLQGGLRASVLPKTRIDTGGQNAIVAGVGYIGIILAVVLAITSAGIDLTSLAFIAGALSLGIGFGLQNIVSNFVSGIILLIERPVAEGDWIDVAGQQGIVKKISVRSTHLETFDRTMIVLPNTDLVQQSVTNWTRNNLAGRIIPKVTVPYGSDTRQIERILLEIAEDQPTVLINPPPAVMITGFGPNGINFEIRAVISDIFGGVGVASEMYHAIVQRFAAEGISIPLAQHDLWLRSHDAETLMEQGAGDASAEVSADGTLPERT